MPPRRSARLVTQAAELCAFPALPAPLAHRILVLLSVDDRARCALVSRGWRATLSAPELWLALDMSAASGLAPSRRTASALLGATRCAGGAMLSLDASAVEEAAPPPPWPRLPQLLPADSLARFVARHAPRLEELTFVRDLVDAELSPREARALLAASPALRVATLAITVQGGDEAGRMLRREAPYERVRLIEILVRSPLDVPALLADSAAQPALQLFRVSGAPLHEPAALEATVNALLQRKVWRLGFTTCGLCPASAPALARLLREGSVKELGIYVEPDGFGSLLDDHAAALLGEALRANRTLTCLKLGCVGLWRRPQAGAALVTALAGHPTLRELGLWSNHVAPEEAAVAGEAIAAVIAADSPALKELRVASCSLRDEGLAPIFEALQRNSNLRLLDCSGSDVSNAFCVMVMLPLALAKPGLKIVCDGFNADAAEELRERARLAAGQRLAGPRTAVQWDAALGL